MNSRPPLMNNTSRRLFFSKLAGWRRDKPANRLRGFTHEFCQLFAADEPSAAAAAAALALLAAT